MTIVPWSVKKCQVSIEWLLMHGWSIFISIAVGIIILGIVLAAVVYFRQNILWS